MTLITIILMFLGPVLGYMTWSVATLNKNVHKARQLNVPYICVLVDGNNMFWAIFQPYVWRILDRLPFQWSSYPDFIRYSRRGWEYIDGSSTHVHLGPVWALITPVAVYLQFADPDAINAIFTRRSDFVRPTKEYKLLEVYGPCVSTAGDDWARHRRVLAAPFNESIMEFVWNESLRQAGSMLRYWSLAGESGVPSMQRDTRTLSLNVLASAAFRKSYPFHGSNNPRIDEASNYRDSLQTILDNIVPLMLIPYRFLTSPLIPHRWAKVGKAAVSFKEHMAEMLENETKALKDGMPGSGGIMTAFARALKTHSEETNSSKPSTRIFKKGLSVDEIFGDVFVINFAGHDTTAVTLAFTMLLLAANPPVQEWISEEISAVTKDIPTEEWDYKSLFPALNRTRAVLLETLRVYPPIMGLPKWTSQKAQTISVSGRTFTIPPGVSAVICLKAIQSHPDYWVDPYAWKPSRWISQTNSVSASSTRVDQHHERLLSPKSNTYFPWSDGPQKCPGKKFAEVEAVAVLACLFRQHRIFVKKMTNESDEAAQRRAIACTNNVTLEALLKMANADKVTLICNQV
ncbi:hypothetical protein GQX73_g6347 [Xylaria multiplex]|uniref:Cytochrome P450 n=1 Tax=Xylaria multiplex TaxID=323545 RepID=A0A7C8MT15_9PEZI|nr:hypothetical protein GQX73_g6347 [Xylaria multiplex]